MRPDDECPYEKPFPVGFHSCPAYAPRTYVALDLQYRPLPPLWTCSHLRTRRGSAGGFYAGCGLGDEAARLDYAASLATSRVALVKRIRAEAVALSTPGLEELWALKGREMVATRRGDARAAAALGQELTTAAEAFNARNDSHVASYADELREMGVDSEGIAEMSRSYVSYMVASTTTMNNWTVPEHLLERFPEDVRKLLRAEGQPQTSQSPERAS